MSEEPAERKPKDFLNLPIAIGIALMLAGIYFFQGLLTEDAYGDFTFTLALCTSSLFAIPGLIVFILGIPQTRKQKIELEKRVKEITDKFLRKAKKYEKLLEFDKAAEVYKNWGTENDVIRVRKLKAEQGAVKVDQTIVHGDYVDDRDTIVKDSVISKSSIGGGSSKMQELEKLTEMKKEGLIDDAEFRQMKKEILGK